MSTGREDNFNLIGTEGGHQMGSNDAHQMAAVTTSQNAGLGSSHHMVTGEFDSHNSVPEFLTGRTRPQSDSRPQSSYNREESVPETTMEETMQFQNGHARPNSHNPFDRLVDVI